MVEPKIIIPIIIESRTLSDEQIKEIKIMAALMAHELQNLKQIFYILLNINVPKDLLNESDLNYIKSNLCKIILFYFQKVWANKIINLNDKFFKCKQCNQWSYFVYLIEYTNGSKVCFKPSGLCSFCSDNKPKIKRGVLF